MTVSIIGAGMAGLLAGAMFRGEAQLYEAARSLPNNHHALLRFRSDEIAQHLNLPFQAVDVMKIVKPFRNKVAEAAGYSMKSNGKASLRSIQSAQGKVDKRFIAPHDFIEQLEDMQVNEIRYDVKVDRPALELLSQAGPIISTMPMGALMKVLEYPAQATFDYRHGWVVKADLMCPSDLCATIYYPDPSVPIIRATLTGQLMQVEMVAQFDRGDWSADRVMDLVLADFGLDDVGYSAEMVPQQYAKIVNIDDRERRKFIMWATDEFGIYSIGRFATWKERLLLDDVFHDIQKVMGMIRDGGCNYQGRLPRRKVA